MTHAPEITIHLWGKCSSRINKVPIEEWVNATGFEKKKEHYTLKKIVPGIKHSNLQRKVVYLGTVTLYHKLFS